MVEVEHISVMVVDDNALLRASLLDTIKDEADLQWVGDAANGEEALERYRELRPDIVTMDKRMPILSGLDATRGILAEFPDARIIMISIYDAVEEIQHAKQAGVCGYLSKNIAQDEILSAIRAVAAGGDYFPEPFPYLA